MDFITRDELDKILQGFEKLGASEKYVGKMDVDLRAYQRKNIDELELKMSQLIDNKISVINDKLIANIKISENTIKTNAMKEVGDILDKTRSHISESVLNTVYKSLKDIAVDTDNKINSQLTNFKNKMVNDAEQLSRDLDIKVSNNLNMFERTIESQVHDSISRAINHSATLFSKTMTEVVQGLYSNIIQDISNLRTSLSEELSRKIVDKAAIEAKFQEIENEMKNKIQQTINFQIEQARFMMEQSAKAEIDDSLKNLTGNFLGSL